MTVAAPSGSTRWGLPLIVLLHVSGLGLISQRVVHGKVGHMIERRHPKIAFVVIVGATTLLAMCLDGIEAGIWTFAHKLLDATRDFRPAMVYPLNAITSYGHTDLALPDHWHLMGAMEALNGWPMSGLTTAFLFAVIQHVWSPGSRSEHR